MRGWRSGLMLGIVSASCWAADAATERLFQQCARHLSGLTAASVLRCRHYLDYGSEQDEARRRRVEAYIGKYQPQGMYRWTPTPSAYIERAEDQAILVPDLLRRDGNHQVTVVRTYGSAWEAAMLRRAEAIYPAKCQCGCAANDWACGALRGEMREAALASPAALQYYLGWSQAAREGRSTVAFERSELLYLAGIVYRERYQIGEQVFQRVYVADVELGWGIHNGNLNGTGFMRHKIVVFNGDGSVAAVFDGDPLNMIVWNA